MADVTELEILRKGVEAWNQWYKSNYNGGANLREANLRCVDLTSVNLAGANLEGADLQYSNLTGANLTNALLREAKLGRANLRGASLRGASGLTLEQLHHAEGNAQTELPWGLERPQHWLQQDDHWESDLTGFAVG